MIKNDSVRTKMYTNMITFDYRRVLCMKEDKDVADLIIGQCAV